MWCVFILCRTHNWYAVCWLSVPFILFRIIREIKSKEEGDGVNKCEGFNKWVITKGVFMP